MPTGISIDFSIIGLSPYGALVRDRNTARSMPGEPNSRCSLPASARRGHAADGEYPGDPRHVTG